jgi:hypothetical protein
VDEQKKWLSPIIEKMKAGKHGSGWNLDVLENIVRFILAKKQYIAIKDPMSGRYRSIVGWIYMDDSYLDMLVSKVYMNLKNEGPNVFPVFAINNGIGRALMSGIGRRLVKMARERGGRLWSYRHGRLMEV